MNKLLIAAIATVGFSTAALAQEGTDFASVDVDGSGDVSFEEAQAAWPELTAEAFAAYDIDGSGGLTPEEYDALVLGATAPAEEAPIDDVPIE